MGDYRERGHSLKTKRRNWNDTNVYYYKRRINTAKLALIDIMGSEDYNTWVDSSAVPGIADWKEHAEIWEAKLAIEEEKINE